jgi:hypothetical protein
VNLTEWIDREVDIAAAAYDANPTLENQVRVNQKFLATVAAAMQIVDRRLTRLEVEAGLDPIEISPH